MKLQHSPSVRVRGRVAPIAVATATIAAGLAAGAAGPAGAATTVRHHGGAERSVAGHVREADRALHRLVHVRGHRTSALAALRSQVSAAGAEETVVFDAAHTLAQKLQAVIMIVSVVRQQTRDIAQLSKLVAGADAADQPALQQLITDITRARDEGIALLKQMEPELPAPAQAKLAAVIATLTDPNAGEPGSPGAGGSGSPGSPSCAQLSQYVRVLTATVMGLQERAGQLERMIAYLPADVRSSIQGALDVINQKVADIETALKAAIPAFVASCPVVGPPAPPVGGPPVGVPGAGEPGTPPPTGVTGPGGFTLGGGAGLPGVGSVTGTVSVAHTP